MLNKPLSHDVYQIFLPYPGYWPEVHEIRYEPTAQEFGGQPRFIRKDGVYKRMLLPAMFRPNELEFKTINLGMVGERCVPLKQILSMENAWYEATGRDYYKRHMGQPFWMVHLIVEKNGEPLAHYFASASHRYQFQPEDIVFGDLQPEEMQDPRMCGMMLYDTANEFPWECAPFTREQLRAERYPEPTLRQRVIDLSYALNDEELAKLADSIKAYFDLPSDQRRGGNVVV